MATLTYAGTRKTVAVVLLVLGLGLCLADFAFERYLRRISPGVPSSSTGETIQEGRGPPYFFVTKDGELVLGIPFGAGVLVAGIGGRLWIERIRVK